MITITNVRTASCSGRITEGLNTDYVLEKLMGSLGLRIRLRLTSTILLHEVG
jgi:hypothetical protein